MRIMYKKLERQIQKENICKKGINMERKHTQRGNIYKEETNL